MPFGFVDTVCADNTKGPATEEGGITILDVADFQLFARFRGITRTQ